MAQRAAFLNKTVGKEADALGQDLSPAIGQQPPPWDGRSIWKRLRTGSEAYSALFVPNVIDSTNTADLSSHGGGAVVSDRPCA
jgi:hypothetical protein